jgi:hypothetical protein
LTSNPQLAIGKGMAAAKIILGWTIRGKAVVNAPQSKRFARCGDAW